jgi:hypothetical protein
MPPRRKSVYCDRRGFLTSAKESLKQDRNSKGVTPQKSQSGGRTACPTDSLLSALSRSFSVPGRWQSFDVVPCRFLLHVQSVWIRCGTTRRNSARPLNRFCRVASCLTTFSTFVFLFGYAFKRFAAFFLFHELAAFFAAGRFIALCPMFISRILHLRTLLHRAFAIIFICVFCYNVYSLL